MVEALMQKLLELIYRRDLATWSESADEAFKELFGGATGRYPDRARNAVQIRAPKFNDESNVPFSTLIEPSNPKSGPYGGMSVGVFPVSGEPCLIALGTGTTGLHPDETILSRPCHARKARAICEAINRREKRFAAWAKHDPTRNDLPVPENVVSQFDAYTSPLKRYGKDVHAIYRPTNDRAATEFALKAFLDLYFEERGFTPLAAHKPEYDVIRAEYFKCLMPHITAPEVINLLAERRFVVLEGPPGTGKTRMALELVHGQYGNKGHSIQFHPNTTYENFIGGLSPSATGSDVGFRFEPLNGELMKAAAAAAKIAPEPYLLHVDEINRADLSKVLGEAVFLLEYGEESPRTIVLPYDFGFPFGNKLFLPSNLHIVGTMNSADRSIAIVDVAIRRRFAFVKLWPQFGVVQASGSKLAEEAFRRLISIFTEYASEDAFALMPGHSYFLPKDGQDGTALRSLHVNLLPLLGEYLAQGYVTSFADHLRGYCQWVESLSVDQP
jgi:5-methylcytosine-specific restriction protein B